MLVFNAMEHPNAQSEVEPFGLTANDYVVLNNHHPADTNNHSANNHSANNHGNNQQILVHYEEDWPRGHISVCNGQRQYISSDQSNSTLFHSPGSNPSPDNHYQPQQQQQLQPQQSSASNPSASYFQPNSYNHPANRNPVLAALADRGSAKSPVSDPERLERKRERNRIAASKCRQRKIQRITTLEKEVSILMDQKRELENRSKNLIGELDELKRQLQCHQENGCKLPNFNGEIKQEDLKPPEGFPSDTSALS